MTNLVSKGSKATRRRQDAAARVCDGVMRALDRFHALDDVDEGVLDDLLTDLHAALRELRVDATILREQLEGTAVRT